MTAETSTSVATVNTVCSYCGVGCGIVLDVGTDADGRRVALRSSGDREHHANRGRLCTKGVTSVDMLAAPGRMTSGLVRDDRDAEPVACTTDEAIARAAGGLRRILDEHGPDAIALYVSGQMTMEAQYLANKLAKGFIGTNQIESNSRLCMASAGVGYKQSLGSDAPPGSYDDLDHADVFLVIGANMADCHPILFLRMLDRMREGAKLIVVDPRRTATADKADLFLQVRPGTDLALLNGLLHLVAADGNVDEAFIAEHTQGWDEMGALLADSPPDVVAATTGIAEADLRRAAAMIGGAANWVTCWTMGLNQSVQGTWNTNAICNLHLATGAICRTGSGPLSLTGQPNAMGGREMGYMGPGLPGQRSVLVEADRRFAEERWALPPGTLRTEPGAGTVDLFTRMAAGEVKACWIICTNPIASVANRGTVIAGLEAAELVITQDAFVDTETNAYADIVLPAAMWAEGDGVMVNSERNIVLAPRAVDPPDGALADWELIARIACAMGFAEAFTYSSAEEVFEEIRGFSNPATGYDLRGATYDRLRTEPLQWPISPGGPARNPIRYLNDGAHRPIVTANDGHVPRLAYATPNGRAAFHPRAHGAAAEPPDDDFPFTFNTGRLAHQWHTMTKTGKVAKLTKLDPAPFVEIHPDDAAPLGIAAGDLVEVASRRGRAVLPAVVTDRVLTGCCFAPFHWNDLYGEYASVNAVTSDAVDPFSFQPAFKMCAVSLTRIATPKAAALPLDGELVVSASAGGGSLRAQLGLATAAPPVLDEPQRRYLDGFLTGVHIEGARGGVPTLPVGAPFDPLTTAWVNGLLAGMHSRTDTSASVPALTVGELGVAQRTVAVLWASQTGTAAEFAAAATARLAEAGFRASLQPMSTFRLEDLGSDSDVVAITSTFGSGEPPDNGVEFWRNLSGPGVPRLEGVRFAVLALGDSSYADFCGHGRRLDERLHELGAERVEPRVDCEPDFETAANGWLERIVDGLRRAPRDPALRIPVAPGEPFQAARHGEVPTRAAPLLARLAGNRLLTGAGSAKEVREFLVDTAGSALVYEAGDSLGVWPTNDPDLVAEWLTVMGAARDEVVELPGLGAIELRSALRDHLEIARITPRLLGLVAELNGDRDLRKVADSRDADALAAWSWGRQAVDLVDPSAKRAPAQAWVDVFPRLQPRQYSIASSPLQHPHRLRLTVSTVRFDVAGKRRNGVCSTFLADSERDSFVPVFVKRAAHFRPPADPLAPAIMIGAGTGVAPFIGFLEERRARGDGGRNWLFFGEQRRSTDHYYANELDAFRADGVLHHLDVAFSRDQPHRVYVQHRICEQGARLWAWLEGGAHVYVCGDMNGMAKGVHAALHDLVALHGGMSVEEADAYLRHLAETGRYSRDVY